MKYEWGFAQNAESKKCHGCYEKKKEEKSARKRTGARLGRWLEPPLELAGVEVVDSEADEVCVVVVDVENPEVEEVTEGVGKVLKLG